MCRLLLHKSNPSRRLKSDLKRAQNKFWNSMLSWLWVWTEPISSQVWVNSDQSDRLGSKPSAQSARDWADDVSVGSGQHSRLSSRVGSGRLNSGRILRCKRVGLLELDPRQTQTWWQIRLWIWFGFGFVKPKSNPLLISLEGACC